MYLWSIFAKVGYPQPAWSGCTLWRQHCCIYTTTDGHCQYFTPQSHHNDIQHFTIQEWKHSVKLSLLTSLASWTVLRLWPNPSGPLYTINMLVISWDTSMVHLGSLVDSLSMCSALHSKIYDANKEGACWCISFCSILLPGTLLDMQAVWFPQSTALAPGVLPLHIACLLHYVTSTFHYSLPVPLHTCYIFMCFRSVFYGMAQCANILY